MSLTRPRLPRSAAFIASALLSLACGHLLGYDDLSIEERDGAAGSAGKGSGGSGHPGGGSFGIGSGGNAGGAAGTIGSGGSGEIGTDAAATGAVGGTSGTGGTGGGASGGSGGESTDVCTRWQNDRADLSEGAWSGDIASCNPGDIAANGRVNALRVLNLYRWLAGLPAVGDDGGLDAQAQQCALMMNANGQLNHFPPASWKCYSAAGASSAASSNIAMYPAVAAVDRYMLDDGNPTTIGHRRWILSNWLGPVGIGSTSSFSCLQVIGGGGAGTNPWTAFPPPGEVPIGIFSLGIDSTGWTIQSDGIDLTGAQVSVSDAGTPQPVTVTKLAESYGSNSAIRFNPQGWTTQAGHTYSVAVSGVSTPINYDVQVVSCP